MEQYFNLNYILDNATQLSVGIMYLDNERWNGGNGINVAIEGP